MFDAELQALGLSDNQRAVYSGVLELGKTTPARLSSLTNINRTTVYAVCKELVQKGYIQEDDLKGITYYSPTPPKDLIKITKKERQALAEKELTLAELAKSLQSMPQSKKYAVPKIRFIEHEENVINFLYEHADSWYAGLKPSEHVWYGFQDHTLVAIDSYRDWIDAYWKVHRTTTDLFLLSNDTEAEKQMGSKGYEGRNIKFWKKGFDFTETQWIVGDYSIMIMTREKPNYLVELHDAVYADNMRKLFKNLWEEIK